MEVSLNKVSFDYGGEPILHDISFTINQPGLISIIGPNGVGKSTLVKCINRLLTPKSGTITIDGVDINEISRKDLSKKIGFVPAGTTDVFAMTVLDTVLVGRHNFQKWKTTSTDLEIVHRALEMLDLDEFTMRSFNELSAGQHQRVAIARGLVQETSMLILDEPTSNLDVNHQIFVTELLKVLSKVDNIIILMISHDLNIAARYSDTIIVMKKPGVIFKIGKPSDVITEDTIREVYNVDSKIIMDDGSPHVILKNCIDRV